MVCVGIPGILVVVTLDLALATGRASSQLPSPSVRERTRGNGKVQECPEGICYVIPDGVNREQSHLCTRTYICLLPYVTVLGQAYYPNLTYLSA